MSDNAFNAKDDPSTAITANNNSEELSIRKSQRERKPSNRFRDVTESPDDDHAFKHPPFAADEANDVDVDVAPAERIRISIKSERDSEDTNDGMRHEEELPKGRIVTVSLRLDSQLMPDTLVANVPCQSASCVRVILGEGQHVDSVQPQEPKEGLVVPTLTKITPERNRCRYHGCMRYRQSHTGGYCLTHKHFGVLMVERDASSNMISPYISTTHAAAATLSRDGEDLTPMPDGNQCTVPYWQNVKQSYAGGYCHTQSHLGIPTVAEQPYSAMADVGEKEEAHTQHTRDVQIKVRIRTKYNICEGYTHALIDPIVFDGLWQRLGLTKMGDRKDPPENLMGGGLWMNGFIMPQPQPDIACTSNMDAKPIASSLSINQDDIIEGALIPSADPYTSQTDTNEISNNPPPLAHKQPSRNSSLSLTTTLPPGISISSSPPKNSRGRSICKVNGCTKLDQSNNQGFCRSHYNLLVNEEHHVDGATDGPWTCQCGLLVGAKQKRCGVCFRWKGGIRETYIVNGKKTEGRVLPPAEGETMPPVGASWTCECGNHVEEHKSRCGKCHHWRGGKRQGGWKLGAKLTVATEVEDDGIDRSTDWTCCGEVISARKTRCGKCRGWRGGKRKVRWTYDGAPREKKAVPTRDVRMEGGSVEASIDWECKKCNNMNHGGKKRCAKCASWRFSRKKLRMSASYSSSGKRDNDESPSAETGGHWICQSCSFDNFSTEIKCLMCQMLRPNWQKYSKSIPTSIGGEDEEHEDIFHSRSFVATNNPTASVGHDRAGGMAAASAVDFSNYDAAGADTSRSRDESTTNLATITNLSHAAQIDCDHLLNSIGPLNDASLNEFGLLHNQGNYSKSQQFHNSLNDNSNSFHINGSDDHFLDNHVDDSIAFGNHPGVGSTFSNPSYLTSSSLHGGSNNFVDGNNYVDGNNGSSYSDTYSHYDNLLGGDVTGTADYVQSNVDGASGFETNTSDESKITENIVQV